MTNCLRIVLAVMMLAGSAFSADPVTWDAVQAESVPKKKSRLALELALASVDGVVTAFHEGLPDQANAMALRIVEAAELSLESLETPDAKPRHFKKAEIATRKLVRSLKSVQRDLHFAEREQLEPIIEEIEEINSQLLTGAMRRR